MQEGESGTRAGIPAGGPPLASFPTLSSSFPGSPFPPFLISSQHGSKATHCDGKKSPSSEIIARPPDVRVGCETDLPPPPPLAPSERLLCFVIGLGEPRALPAPIDQRNQLARRRSPRRLFKRAGRERRAGPCGGEGRVGTGESLKGLVSEQIASL